MCPVCGAKRYFGTRGNEKVEECFVVSTIYGSKTAPEVVRLRRFRDDVLMRMPLGRAFVRAYYAGLGQTSAYLVRLTGAPGRAVCRRFLSLFVQTLQRRQTRILGEKNPHVDRGEAL
jgi:hypothetical protein